MPEESTEEYERLKSQIIHETQNSYDLEKVKDFFKSDINSKRALSRVQSLQDIFHLLEERDELHSQKVTALLYLGNLLGNEAIVNLVKVYQKLHGTREQCLCGQDDLYKPSASVTATENPVLEQRTVPSIQPVQLAIKNIASNIGSKWRVLASELDIPEHHIDDIRRKYPQDFSTQALKVLEIWFQYNNGNATLEALETALEARLCRMKGLGLHLLRPAVKVE